jgi:hypothetical protein
LDDPSHYKSNPWNGFTSDEVTVTVTAGSFTKSLGTILIKSFGDYNFANDVEDKVAPQINVNYDFFFKCKLVSFFIGNINDHNLTT